MAAATERYWAILDSESMLPAIDSMVDTSDYVPDEEVIKAGIVYTFNSANGTKASGLSFLSAIDFSIQTMLYHLLNL